MKKQVRPNIKLENGIWHCKGEQCQGLGYTVPQSWADYKRCVESKAEKVNYDQFIKLLGA
jgi:hypothetical protein